MNSSRTLRLGRLQIDVAKRTLQRGQDEVRVPARVFDLLIRLIEADGAVLSRQELIDSVWHDVVVADGSLTQAVSDLRRALGDEGLIVTVPGRGYRFAGDIASCSTASGSPAPVRGSSRKWKLFLGLVVIVLAAATVAVLVVGRPSGSEPRSIAVLPLRHGDFQTASERRELQLTDLIIQELSLATTLRVRPSAAVMEFADPRRDTPAEAGRQLGVERVVAGHLSGELSGVRVVLQLVEVDSNRVLWSGEVTGEWPDLKTLARAVADRLVAATPPSSDGTSSRR